MKILLIHTYYIIRGGEDAVFEQEARLLSNANEVQTLNLKNSGGVRGLLQFIMSIWNIFSALKLKKEIAGFQPDVIHIHNLHFAASPLLIRTAKKIGIPIVITLHNYRLICPSAVLLHKGKIFTDSLSDNFPWQAVKNKVYRDSFFQTFWSAFVVWFHKKIGTWQKLDKYIVLSDCQRQLILNSKINIREDKITIKPNFVLHEKKGSVVTEKEPFFLFIGRLSEEKGIDCLLGAFEKNGLKLEIGGDGPFINKVKESARKHPNITYIGIVEKNEVLKKMQICNALIVPSICYETFGLATIEAFSVGTPVIASDIGSMQTIIQDGYNGLLFQPNDADALNEILQVWIELSVGEKKEYSDNALKTYNELYTPEKNYIQLMDIYKSVIDAKEKTDKH